MFTLIASRRVVAKHAIHTTSSPLVNIVFTGAWLKIVILLLFRRVSRWEDLVAVAVLDEGFVVALLEPVCISEQLFGQETPTLQRFGNFNLCSFRLMVIVRLWQRNTILVAIPRSP
jgi:hypothetical protein